MEDELNQASMISSVGSSIEVLSMPKDPVEDEDFSDSLQASRHRDGGTLIREHDVLETQRKIPVDAEDSVSRDPSMPEPAREGIKEEKVENEDGEDTRSPKRDVFKDDSIWFLSKEIASRVFGKTIERTTALVQSVTFGPNVEDCLAKGKAYITDNAFTVVLVAILAFYIIQFHQVSNRLQVSEEQSERFQWEIKSLDKKIQAWAKEFETERKSLQKRGKSVFEVKMADDLNNVTETIIQSDYFLGDKGVYHAPCDGFYQFHATMERYGRRSVTVVLAIGDDDSKAILDTTASVTVSSQSVWSNTLFVELKSGDQVRLKKSDSSSVIVSVLFRGYLIAEKFTD